MHPILQRSGRLGPYLVAWVPVTGILGAFLALAGSLTAVESAGLAVALGPVYAFLCLSSWYVCRATPLRSRTLLSVAATFGVASVVAGSLWALWGSTVAGALGLAPYFATLPERFPKAVPVVFLFGLLLYALVAALHYVLLSLEEAELRERREIEVRDLARSAELRVLREQLSPHFLFNSLNSISALTTQSPARAREMCLLLGEFLRKTIGLSEKPAIPLKDEIDLALNYLSIEKVRFGDRLRVESAVDDDASTCPVPPLLLQPLVENAVKHGVSSSLEGGTIRLAAERVGDSLRLSVENSLERESEEAGDLRDSAAAPAGGRPPGLGVGLANVGRRLSVRYGSAAEITTRRDGELFRVELRLPAEPVATP